ncbi:MAG: WYL domain-containing protein, partial [Duncaniella sp.]|nr:WYL domain-containing protein [Duncaniella sp.]
MARNLLSRYVWLIDTIKRYGNITREELNRLWMLSPLGEGEPLPRRTFYNYRNAIEELFGITIQCNPATYEYFIA